MKRIYVAGPYNSANVVGVLTNMRYGIDMALNLIRRGYAPFCPWLDFQYGLIAELKKETYQAVSMAWVDASDALLIMPGWKNSGGTEREIARAEELGIPVYYSIEDLIKSGM